MSLDIYAAKMTPMDDGRTLCEPVMDFKCSERTRLRKEAREGLDFEGPSFEPNPDYVPGVAMNMPGADFYMLIKHLGLLPDEFEKLGLERQHMAVLDAMIDGATMEGKDCEERIYIMMRLHQLLNVLELGIARGAEKLVWVG